ncbi:MAG TPA: heavy-metal-associated domain-containing protein [Chloroflexota bacterium]|nr:heavy-metal-associated domain-containing protein [Chloroflexota bacterium]
MTSTTAKTIRLSVPELVLRPAVGTSCCAATAEAIVAQELFMLPGIEDVAVDVDGSAVTVTYQPSLVDRSAIIEALDEIGYPAEGA